MSPGRDVARDFVELKLHHVGVGMRKRERRSDAASRADRAEQRWSAGWRGLVPRLAHWRTRPFFWPMRASSSNQISTGARRA
jgi:hypothetical protein